MARKTIDLHIKMLVKSFIFGLVFGLISMTGCATNVQFSDFKAPKDCGLMRDAYERQLRQPKLPLYYAIDYSVPERFQEEIRQAAELWNELLGFEAIVVLGLKDQTYRLANPQVQYVFYEGSDWPFEKNSIMVTSVWFESTLITSSHIYINAELSVNLSSEKIIEIMAHEFGHAMGLPHHPDPVDLMYPRSAPGVKDYSTSVNKIRCAYEDFVKAAGL